MTIVLKGTKGSALTHNEVDGNFSDLDGRVTTLEGAGSGVALTDLSVTTATAGTAALAYDNATGVFTYTPPDVSDYATVSGNLASLESSIASTYLTIAGTNGMIDGHLNVSGATSGQILSWDGSDYAWVADQTGGGALSMPIQIPDGTISSNYIGFGDDDDLKIFHNGSSSIITETNLTSSLILRSYQDVRLADAGGTETMLKAISHGAVELYHNNVKKLETTADGVAVTGKITGLTDPTAAQDAATKAYVDANSGGGGSQSRSTATGTTGSIADAAEEDLDITGFKSYALLTITTDVAARVRLYTTGAARTADAARAEGTDPTSDAGLIAEVITTGAETVTISPGAIGFNLEGTPTTTIPCRVTNKSGSTGTVQVDLNILQLEA